MFDIHTQEIMWAGRKLVLETGRIARQAGGALLVRYGGTTVLCTAVADREAKPEADFFPLTVSYQEKTFAVGKIPGGFFKREGKLSEKETLTSRLIDRPLRPLFPKGFLNEVQVVCTVLSHDLENNPDVPALIGASAALTLSGVPFLGPVAAARVAYKNGQYILNPTPSELQGSTLDLVAAGTQQGILMVESEAYEVDEGVMLGALKFCHESFNPVIQAIVSLAEKAAAPPWDLPEQTIEPILKDKLWKLLEGDLQGAYQEHNKDKRKVLLNAAKKKALDSCEGEEFSAPLIGRVFKETAQGIMRKKVLDTNKRMDGRDLETIRPIDCEASFLPSTHGSALFTRGHTQAIVVATLGTSEDSQVMDTLEGEYREPFLLHYNFPRFSVGEVGRMGPPGRREIGHGKLAWRAIHPLLPSQDAFPYTIRVVSEITESDGSSSMATVCGSSLALMDAGVPIPRPVAGIAMGLIQEGERHAVLSDILGDEDSLGDMDFKVAGTAQGITALQMDLKVATISFEVMEKALAQARDGRLFILQEMAKSLPLARDVLHKNAPRIVVMKINKDKIRDVIGPGGKMIREICETTGAKIDIEDDGSVKIFSANKESLDSASRKIRALTYAPQVGDTFDGTVVKLMDFGAFVNFLPGQDGLVHISELSTKRVAKVSDVLNVGDKIHVKVIGLDNRGKIKLSLKQAVAQDSSCVIS